MKYILKYRFIAFAVSGVCMLLSLALLIFGSLNLGIDMTGGTSTQYSYSQLDYDTAQSEITELANTFEFEGQAVLNGVNIYKISGEDKLAVVAGFYPNFEAKQLDSLKNDFRKQVFEVLETRGVDIVELKYTNIGKSFGDYIRNTAILTLVIALVGIALYVTWAFSGVVNGMAFFSFSAITLVTLLHDILLATGLYLGVSYFFPEFQIDTFFVTALLTILGYSINDTIVVFDRIRANLKNISQKGNNLEKIVITSVSQSVTRSIYTSATLLFVLITIFFFGPESIAGFTLVMIFGTIVGTYSSLFIAAPLIYELNKTKTITKYIKTEDNPEDKIVV